MKNIIFKQLAVCAAAVLAVSCIDRNFDKPATEYGTLAISSVGITEDLREKGHSTRAEGDIDVSNFDVLITSKDGEIIYDDIYDNLAAQYQLYAGEYTIYVESHDVRDAAWEDVHYSVSRDFTIEKGEITEIDELVCKVTNILVSVRFHNTMAQKMADDCVVTIKIGNGSLNYDIDEVRRGAFKDAAAGDNVLVWDFKGTLDGEYFDQTGTIRNVKAGEHRTLTFNTETIERGNGQFVLVVSPEVETYDINRNVVVGDEDVIVPFVLPEITSTHSLTERSTIKKSEGLNESGEPATELAVNITTENELASVILEMTTDNGTLEGFLAQAQLLGQVDLANVTSMLQRIALTNYVGVPINNDVIGKAELPLDFSKLIPLMFNPANNFGDIGVFDIKITAIDNEGFSKTETLRLKFVDDTVVAPVTITGAADGVEFDIDERQIISLSAAPESFMAIIDVPAGIKRFDVVMGATPEGGEFDSTLKYLGPLELVDDANGKLANLIDSGITLPYGDAVRDQTHVEFEIGGFIGFFYTYIESGEFDANFELTVTDSNDISATKTLKLHITE